MIPRPGRARTIVALGAALFLAGCWDRVEVNDLAIVQGVALDWAGPDQIELTVFVAVPNEVTPPGATGGGGGRQGPAATSKSATGRTVAEAIDRLQEKLSRRLFWAHNAVILIGEDLAKEGVLRVLDFFTRHRQPRLRTPIAIVPGRASDVLATTFPVERNVPVGIREIERFQLHPFSDVRRFMTALALEGEEPLTAVVHVGTGGAPEPGALRTPPQENPELRDPSQPVVSGAAVFKDDRMVGMLPDEDARGLLTVRGELQAATTIVTLGEPGKWVGFELTRAESRIVPRFEGDRLIMAVEIATEHTVVDNPAAVDASDPGVIGLLEQELRELIAVRVRRAIEKVQELRSDVLGFGGAVRRARPDVWRRIREDWDAIFSEVEVEVSVEPAVMRTGLSERPVGAVPDDVISADELRSMLEGK